jgi:phage FluMu gp28-like protein
MPDARWEAFQIAQLSNESTLAICNKSRQVGWSWLAAADAVAWGALAPRTTSIFVSINQDEAAEKIRYAQAVIEGLDHAARPRLTINNKYEIEFANGSRLISHPCRPVRGKARARIYLDEFAHYMDDRKIYQSAVPVITKGGVVRIGSSPLGGGGLFWEIYTQATQSYPGYKRFRVPWWLIRSLSVDIKRAVAEAPGMLTEQRVLTFGTERLIEIYANVPLQDFQQEYECAWVDESVAWIDWALIQRNQALAQTDGLWYRVARTPDTALAAIEDLAQAVSAGLVETAFVGGMDVGRKHDTTEFVLLGRATTNQLPFRLGITLDRIDFDTQFQVLGAIMERLPVISLHIDSFGLGMQLAEAAVRSWGVRIHAAEFTNPNKELWAVEVKVRFQRVEMPIPLERDLVYQIHSIKRKTTAAKNQVFDTEANESHHADKFWALALATWAGKTGSVAQEWIAALTARTVPPKVDPRTPRPVPR